MRGFVIPIPHWEEGLKITLLIKLLKDHIFKSVIWHDK